MPKDHEDILLEARERFETASGAEFEMREDALKSINFTDGDQWPADIKNARESAKPPRPCLTINKMRTFVMSVVGDILQNMPSIKVRPVDAFADIEGALVRTELIRHIENLSNAKSVYGAGFEQACNGGYGYWRIRTVFTDDDVFDQDIKIEGINNRFTVYFDPNAKKNTKEDAEWAFISEFVIRKNFKRMFPGKDETSFDVAVRGEQYEAWFEDDKVRIAEYYWKEPVTKEIIHVINDETGQEMVIDADDGLPDGFREEKSRTVDSHKVMWAKISGTQILEGPTEIPSKMIPIVPCIGNDIDIEGKKRLRSLIFDAIDSQRMYNYFYTIEVERLSLQSKSPWIATKHQLNGHEAQWKQSNVSNEPYLLYNPDELAPGAPKREPPPQSSSGHLNQMGQASADMRETTGIFQSNLGQQDNARSGRAIIARQRQGDSNTYKFVDNFLKAVTYTGKILLDMMPRIFDNERILRITGEPEERLVELNVAGIDPKTGESVIINDMTSGKYDYMPEAGVHYLTKRAETLASMLDFIQFVPQLAPILAEDLAKLGDWPGAQEIAEKIKAFMQGQQQAEQGAQAPQASVEGLPAA